MVKMFRKILEKIRIKKEQKEIEAEGFQSFCKEIHFLLIINDSESKYYQNYRQIGIKTLDVLRIYFSIKEVKNSEGYKLKNTHELDNYKYIKNSEEIIDLIVLIKSIIILQENNDSELLLKTTEMFAKFLYFLETNFYIKMDLKKIV